METSFEDYLLVEDPDKYFTTGTIIFGLLKGRWVYDNGTETHTGILKEIITLYRLGKQPYNTLPYIFPKFNSDKEKQEWMKSIDNSEVSIDDNIRTDVYAICGRMTDVYDNSEPNIISFWNPSQVVKKYLPELEQFFKHIKRPISKYQFEPIDFDGHPIPYNMFKLEVRPSIQSRARIKELLKKQHLDPNTKKELGFMPSKSDNIANKAGFTNAASFRHYMGQESFKIDGE